MADRYDVVSQRQTTRITESGQFEEVIEVTFRTKSGVTAKVAVPVANYTAEAVHEAIDDMVERLDAVKNL